MQRSPTLFIYSPNPRKMITDYFGVWLTVTVSNGGLKSSRRLRVRLIDLLSRNCFQRVRGAVEWWRWLLDGLQVSGWEQVRRLTQGGGEATPTTQTQTDTHRSRGGGGNVLPHFCKSDILRTLLAVGTSRCTACPAGKKQHRPASKHNIAWSYWCATVTVLGQ